MGSLLASHQLVPPCFAFLGVILNVDTLLQFL